MRNDASTPHYDDLDRRLVHALQLDARVPFARLAAVLDVSDQTVARRYARLRATGAVRAVGLPSMHRVGEGWWIVRVECLPGTATDLAHALSRREDTRWVTLLSGGTEVSLSARVPEEEDAQATLLDRLPRSRRAVRVTALGYLHTFFGGPLSLVNKLGALSPEQAARLLPPGQDPTVSLRVRTEPPTAEEARLLAVLAQDARAPFGELAAATGWSQSTVRRRLAEMRAGGAVYFDVEYDWRLFGLGARASLWLSVKPAALAETGAAMAGHPEVAFCAATTGPTNLYAVVICADTPALYTYLTTRVAALPGVERMETAPVLRTVKGIAPRCG